MLAPPRRGRPESRSAVFLTVLAAVLLASCGRPPPPEPDPPPRPPPPSYRFDRLLVLPILSLGDLDRVRPAARRSLVLAFSARTDSLILLPEEDGEDANGSGRRDRPVPVDSLYTTRCDFGLVRERLPAEVGQELRVDGLHALCADLGYRRRPPDSDTLQTATAVGRIWSGRRDSVVWRDSVSVTVRLDRSRLSPDTIASLLTEAILRLRDRLP